MQEGHRTAAAGGAGRVRMREQGGPDLTRMALAVTIRCQFEFVGGKMVLSTVALISAAVSGVLKLLADAFELFSRTDDVANKPAAKDAFQNAKAIMNLAAAGAVAYAAICQFAGPDWFVGGFFLVLGGLFALTLGAYLFVLKH